MKKWGIIFVILILLCTLYGFVDRVSISSIEAGEVRFQYAENDIKTALTSSDCSTIQKIFQNKVLFTDMPSCGFSESVSVQLNGGEQVFCIARDGCDIIYWKNVDKYFKLSLREKNILHSILNAYGVFFPCV